MPPFPLGSRKKTMQFCAGSVQPAAWFTVDDPLPTMLTTSPAVTPTDSAPIAALRL